MENTAKNIFNQIGIPSNLQTWESLDRYDKLNSIMKFITNTVENI